VFRTGLVGSWRFFLKAAFQINWFFRLIIDYMIFDSFVVNFVWGPFIYKNLTFFLDLRLLWSFFYAVTLWEYNLSAIYFQVNLIGQNLPFNHFWAQSIATGTKWDIGRLTLERLISIWLRINNMVISALSQNIFRLAWYI